MNFDKKGKGTKTDICKAFVRVFEDIIGKTLKKLQHSRMRNNLRKKIFDIRNRIQKKKTVVDEVLRILKENEEESDDFSDEDNEKYIMESYVPTNVSMHSRTAEISVSLSTGTEDQQKIATYVRSSALGDFATAAR
uniref:BESS domain-containing protein n=1 Tax=Strongyloides venezuelensis TaxID=75913 RepID=A0A0K0FQ46_STRVS